MTKITKLDESLIRHVAAGEVVQRPASILKECLENSIDAGADAIEIVIENGGVGQIKIKDNGSGIEKDELPLAIERHATSKIRSINDLENIVSFGFRGEALSSIAAVSRFSIESRHEDAEIGAKIELFDSSNSVEIIPSSCSVGTIITVKDLFFNVPARRRFLRADRTEYNYLDDVIKKIALSNFGVSFKVTNNGKQVRLLEALTEGNHLDRIAMLLGDELAQNLHLINEETNGLKISGWVSKPYFSRGQADMQYFFVNGRAVKDKAVSHAIRRAYSDMMQSGRHPSYVLYLDLDPSVIDVNVHPSKEEIRFTDSRSVAQFVYRAIKKVLVMPIDAEYSGSIIADTGPIKSNSSAIFVSENRWEANAGIAQIDTKSMPSLSDKQHAYIASDIKQEQQIKADMQGTLLSTQKSLPTTIEPPLGYALAQLSGLFILAENKHGLMLIDMHAAHERVIYEQMKQAYEQKNVISQILLVPIKTSLNSLELETIDEFKSTYQKLGFSFDLREGGVVINKVPVLLRNTNITQLFTDITAEIIKHNTHDCAKLATNEIISTMACHSAVRANDYLTREQMNGLLRTMEKTKSYEQCNHGRPTCKQLTISQLDGFFRRGT